MKCVCGVTHIGPSTFKLVTEHSVLNMMRYFCTHKNSCRTPKFLECKCAFTCPCYSAECRVPGGAGDPI